MANTQLPDHAAAYLGKFLTSESTPPDYEAVKFAYKGHAKDENSDMNILGITSDPNATGYYRIQNPLRLLAKSGAKVRVVYVPELSYMDMNLLDGCNYVIMSRATDKALFDAVLEVCNRRDITLVYDLDDFVDDIPKTNPSHAYYNENDQEKIKNVHHALQNSHGVIFSTRTLQEKYKTLAPYSHVMPNALDFSLETRNWEQFPQDMWKMIAKSQGCNVTENSKLFGWSGGISHIEDLDLLGEVVPQVLLNVPESIFCMYCAPVLAAQYCIEKWSLPPNRVMYIPVKSYQAYPGYLSLFDVALIPLANHPFNACKSDIKLMEFNAFGVPYVASDSPEYIRYHVNNHGFGAIVENTEQMTDEVIWLLNNQDKTEQMSKNIINTLQNNGDIAVRMAQYAYTLRIIRDNSKSVLKMPSAVSILDASNRVY